MFSHERIWLAVDRLAESTGYSTSGLARRAGLDPTTFNKSKRFTPEGKPRWPSTESIARVLAVTGANLSDFMALADNETDAASAGAATNKVPVLTLDKARQKAIFDENGFPKGDGWDMLSLPSLAPDAAEHLFALRISNDAYLPVYRRHDILLCSPSAQLRRNDRVALLQQDSQLLLADLTDIKGDAMTVSVIADADAVANSPALRFNRKDCVWVARILWCSQS